MAGRVEEEIVGLSGVNIVERLQGLEQGAIP
jgi:hypothetical protein